VLKMVCYFTSHLLFTLLVKDDLNMVHSLFDGKTESMPHLLGVIQIIKNHKGTSFLSLRHR